MLGEGLRSELLPRHFPRADLGWGTGWVDAWLFLSAKLPDFMAPVPRGCNED